VKCEVECPKCNSRMTYVYKRIDQTTVLVRVECDNPECNYQVAFTVPFQALEVYAPRTAFTIQQYGMAIRV